MQSQRQIEREGRVAKELSDLVVYFQCVNFEPMKHLVMGGIHNEVSSFPENKIITHITANPKGVLKFNKVGMSRVYPKGMRFDSSNYLPISMWNHGCQMVSLNYQTGGKTDSLLRFLRMFIF